MFAYQTTKCFNRLKQLEIKQAITKILEEAEMADMMVNTVEEMFDGDVDVVHYDLDLDD